MRKFVKLEGYWQRGNEFAWGTRYVDVTLMTAFEYKLVPDRDVDGVHIPYTDEELEELDLKGQETHKYVMGIVLSIAEFPRVTPVQFLKLIDAELTSPDTEQEAAA